MTQDLAREMAALSAALNRRVGVLVDRAGHIDAVAVGDAKRVDVPRQPSAPAGRRRLCTLRFLSTRWGDEPLTADELAPLALHRLDALAVIGVGEDGLPGQVRVAHLLPARDGGAAPRSAESIEPPPTRLPRGAPARHRASSRRTPPAQDQDVAADGERYRLLAPRPASRIDEDFLELIRALEQEFDRLMERTKVSGKSGRAILVHVTTGSRELAEASMAELSELAASSDLEVVTRLVQRRARFDARTLMGSGKLQDLIVLALRQGADFIVVDQNLTPAQGRAIAEATDLKVIDRTQLILDIFASRARTHEGKIQVELAQLKYLLPRLMSRGDSGLSRLEGGIGGRGPGEQKLEVDRRRVRDRIRRLEKLLTEERRRRERRRSRRREWDIPVVSIVGYTNAGKSTLLNRLTLSEVFVEHRMFATLDPTSRRLRLPQEREIVINDTVGFIRDLPRDLLAAFRATLEEIEDSDLLLHLVDASHPDHRAHVRAVDATLAELGYAQIPRLVVFNKADRLAQDELADLLAGTSGSVAISALEGRGVDELLIEIDRRLGLPMKPAVGK